MKLFATFALSALLLVPVTAAQALDIQVDVCVQARQNNSCSITQNGTHNFARGAQAGETNTLRIRQRGGHNNAGAYQHKVFDRIKLKQLKQ